MVTKIILQYTLNEQVFHHLAPKWQKNATIIIESSLQHNNTKNSIFNLALNSILDSFSEAVLIFFLKIVILLLVIMIY